MRGNAPTVQDYRSLLDAANLAQPQNVLDLQQLFEFSLRHGRTTTFSAERRDNRNNSPQAINLSKRASTDVAANMAAPRAALSFMAISLNSSPG
jgi:hypothetical protein